MPRSTDKAIVQKQAIQTLVIIDGMDHAIYATDEADLQRQIAKLRS